MQRRVCMHPNIKAATMFRTPITTQRLVIRSFVPYDVPAVHAYTGNPQVMTYVEGGVMTLTQTEAFVAANAGDNARAYAITLRSSGQLIGHSIFHSWFAPHTYELGWVTHPVFQGQGYATEAAQAMLAYAFETLAAHRVIATCQPENPTSVRVMEKLGMRREGHFRQCIARPNNTWWDEYFYATLASEWTKE